MMVRQLDKGHTTNDAYIDVAISMNNTLDEFNTWTQESCAFCDYTRRNKQ